MRIVILIATLFGCAEVTSLRDVAAQPPLAIADRDRPSCPACRFEFTRIAQLTLPDSLDLGSAIRVARDPRGRFHCILSDHSRVAVFDSTGSFIAVYGRKGQGPGELIDAVDLVVGPADSIAINDLGTRRISVFSPDFRYHRSFPLEGTGISFLRLRDGAFVINALNSTRSGIGFPLHLVSPDGAVVRSFGTSDPTVYPRGPGDFQRAIAASPRATIWTVHPRTYRIEEWDLTGHRVRLFQRSPNWLVESGRRRGGPIAGVSAVQEDGRGRVWTSSSIIQPPSARPKGEFDRFDLRRATTVLEVLDPAKGRLVASAHFAGRVLVIGREPSVVYELSDADDRQSIVAYRVILGQPPM